MQTQAQPCYTEAVQETLPPTEFEFLLNQPFKFRPRRQSEVSDLQDFALSARTIRRDTGRIRARRIQLLRELIPRQLQREQNRRLIQRRIDDEKRILHDLRLRGLNREKVIRELHQLRLIYQTLKTVKTGLRIIKNYQCGCGGSNVSIVNRSGGVEHVVYLNH